MTRNSCEDSSHHEPRVFVEKMEGKHDDKAPDNAKIISNDGDDDFFERIRKRQSDVNVEREEQKLSAKIVDSTPSMISLDTHHKDVPDLVSNISPTSVSTTSSDEKNDDEESVIYVKTRGKEIPIYIKTRSTEEVSGTLSSTASAKKNGFLFRRLAFILVFFLSCTAWLTYEERTVQTLTSNLNSFHDQEQDLNLLDIFEYYQDSYLSHHLFNHLEHGEIPENEIQEDQKLDFSSSNIQINKDFEVFLAQSKLFLQSLHSKCQVILEKPIINLYQSAIVFAEHLTLLARSTILRIMQVAEILTLSTSQIVNKLAATTDLLVEQLESATKGMLFRMINSVRGVAEQIADTVVTTTGDMADYFYSTAKSVKSQIEQHVNEIAQNVNEVTKNLASMNSKIQSKSQHMVAGRESLVHVGAAAKSMMLEIDHQVSDIASTNAKIQGGKHNMLGVRDSFTHIGSTCGKRTSRVLSRRIRITSI